MIHSLQQLHSTAKVAAIRYGFDLEKYVLKANVELKEEKGRVHLECSTVLLDPKQGGIVAVGFAPSPALCLTAFEEHLRSKTGKVLDLLKSVSQYEHLRLQEEVLMNICLRPRQIVPVRQSAEIGVAPLPASRSLRV